jgi:DNA-3-methyladenine glycosylase II
VVRRRLSQTYGRTFALPNGDVEAFPTPAELLAIDSFPGLEPQRIERLHGVARAALDGLLEPKPLLEMAPDAALAHLQKLPGIGPMYATLILLRATGATDILTLGEPRLASYVSHYYGLAHPATPEELATIAEGWRPFRTWTAVLTRVAGDRDRIPWAPQPGGGR